MLGGKGKRAGGKRELRLCRVHLLLLEEAGGRGDNFLLILDSEYHFSALLQHNHTNSYT